jgi:RNA polymerase sigma-70 factor, ECF subfamily
VDRAENHMMLAASLASTAAASRAEGGTPRAAADEVFALVYRQIRNLAGRRDVDELAQAAAEQVIRSLPSFQGRSQLATWTFRICYLTVPKHDRWYRRWLRRFTLTDDGEIPELATDTGHGEAAAVQRERLVRLQAGMQELSPKRRAVLVLHDIEELSVEEIAAIVQATPAAVRSRLRDARKALGQILAEDPYFGEKACGEEERT